MAEHLDIHLDINKALQPRGLHFRKELGKGAFGKVVAAKCETDGKSYAIKLVELVDKDRIKYSERELDLLKKLNVMGENVIEYFGHWIVNDVQLLCIQMELCSVNLDEFIYANAMGGPEIIKADGPLRFYQKVFPQILSGIDAIHSIGWVHRDLHPGNILIAVENPQQINDIIVKIADLGLARFIGNDNTAFSGKLSANVGHELVRAPEMSTEEYDFKVDLYSSGIILYLLNCYLPDKAQVAGEILALRARQRGVNHLYHQDDETISKLIHRLLKKNPNDRPTAAEALAMLSAMPMKDFLVKKRNADTWYRCSANDSLLAVQKAIEEHSHIGIKADSQVLQQKYTIENEERLFGITSDMDVRKMFQSAEKTKKKVFIIVSVKDVADPL